MAGMLSTTNCCQRDSYDALSSNIVRFTAISMTCAKKSLKLSSRVSTPEWQSYMLLDTNTTWSLFTQTSSKPWSTEVSGGLVITNVQG